MAGGFNGCPSGTAWNCSRLRQRKLARSTWTCRSICSTRLGGGNSVRGWELGSRRGRNQLIGTAEYRYVAIPVRPFSVAGINLYAGLQVAAFADLGLAWNDDLDRRAASAIDGYGVGLRLQVPFVDLIRIDVAWGEPGEGAFAYFGVGLKAARQRQRVR